MNKNYFVLGTLLLALPILIGASCSKTTTPATNSQPVVKTLSKDGGACVTVANCEPNLNCVSSVCSSGQNGSKCATYKDCEKGLYCLKTVCSTPPSYTKYFNRITISKMKPEPPGPNNIPVPATEFKAGADALELDADTKAGVKGELYYEFINSTTGETVLSSANNKTKVADHPIGTGFMVPGGIIGDFDVNVYFNDELIYTTTVQIN